MATLVISISALALSIVSLSWQAWAWKRTGPVLKVSITHSIPTYGAVLGNDHTTVTASNEGRTAVTVTSWGFETPDGRNLFSTQPVPWSDPMPTRVDAHATSSWHIPTDELLSACQEYSVQHQDLRAWVNTASGKVYARNRGINID